MLPQLVELLRGKRADRSEERERDDQGRQVMRPADQTRLRHVLRPLISHGKGENREEDGICFDHLCAHLQLLPHEKDLCWPFFSFLRPVEKMIPWSRFVFYVWNFCSLSGRALMRFAFGVLSPVPSEVACERHVIRMLKTLNRAGFYDHKVELYEALSGVKHNAHTFSLLCYQYLFLIEPLKHVQHIFRSEIMGENFWYKVKLSRIMAHGNSREESDAGLLEPVVNYYYTENARSILKSKTSEGEYLKSILKENAMVDFLESPYNVIHHKLASCDDLLDERCRSCSCDSPLTWSPSTLMPCDRPGYKTSFQRNRSEVDFCKQSLESSVVNDNSKREYVTRSNSATVLLYDINIRSKFCTPLCDIEGVKDCLVKYNKKNNIYCLPLRQQFLSADVRGQFASCSTLSNATDRAEEYSKILTKPEERLNKKNTSFSGEGRVNRPFENGGKSISPEKREKSKPYFNLAAKLTYLPRLLLKKSKAVVHPI